VWNFSGHQGLTSAFSPAAFSPDDKTLALAQGNIIHLFSLTTGESKDLTVPIWAPTCLAFSSDGSQVAAGSFLGRIDLVSIRDGNIKTLYDPALPSGQQIQQQTDSGQMIEFVSSLFFLDSVHELVSGSNKGVINTFDFGIADRDPKNPPVSSVHVDGMVGAFAMSSGELIAAGTNSTFSSVRVWRVADQKVLIERPDCNTDINLRNFALSSFGGLTATSCVNAEAKTLTYQLWSLPSADALPFPEGLRGVNIHNPIAISADGSVLAVSGEDNRLIVLDLNSGLPPMQMEESPVHPVEAIQAIPKTHELVICTRTQTAIWKNDGTTTVQTFYSNSGPYAFSPDGIWMAYFDRMYKLHVVNRVSGKELGNPIREDNAEEYARHNAGFYNFRIAVSTEGPTVFWMEGGGFSGYAKFWKAGDQTEHILCDTANRGELVVSPSSSYVVVGCNRGQIGFQSSQVLLFRVRDMHLIDEAYGDFSSAGFQKQSTVTGVAFTFDERRYLLAMNNEIQIRSTESKAPLPPIRSDLSKGKVYVGPIAISPDGKFIATQAATVSFSNSSFSEQIEILSAEGKSLKQINVPTLCKSIVFISNMIAVGLQDGTTTLYTVPDLEPRVTLVHPDGWVAVSPSGLFDGNAEALHWVGWRRSDQRAIVPLDLLYDNYFRPDLLNAIINKRYAPRPNVSQASWASARLNL